MQLTKGTEKTVSQNGPKWTQLNKMNQNEHSEPKLTKIAGTQLAKMHQNEPS